MGKRGKREFVQVLRLLENFSHQEVHHAVKDAIRLGAISFDAVNTCCCAASKADHLASILTCIPTYPGSACRPPAPRTT